MKVGFTNVGETEDVVFDGITGAGAVGAVVGGIGACGAVFITGTGAVVLVCIVIVVTEEDKVSKVLVGVEVDNPLVLIRECERWRERLALKEESVSLFLHPLFWGEANFLNY